MRIPSGICLALAAALFQLSAFSAAQSPNRTPPSGPTPPSRSEAQSSRARDEAFYAGLRAIEGPYEAYRRLRETDPARYATETEAYLERRARYLDNNGDAPQALSYVRDTASEIGQLASYVRFSLHDGPRAVTLYRRAIEMHASSPPAYGSLALVERLGLADALRFDLRDVKGALAEYRALQDALSAENPPEESPEASIYRAIIQWCRAEIAFLAQRRPFSGTPELEAQYVAAVVLDYGAHSLAASDLSIEAIDRVLIARPPRDDERASFASQLEALSASQSRLLSTFHYLPMLGTPARISRYMRKHDPTGFLTRSMFAGWHVIEREGPKGNHVGMDVHSWSEADRALMRKAEAESLR